MRREVEATYARIVIALMNKHFAKIGQRAGDHDIFYHNGYIYVDGKRSQKPTKILDKANVLLEKGVRIEYSPTHLTYFIMSKKRINELNDAIQEKQKGVAQKIVDDLYGTRKNIKIKTMNGDVYGYMSWVGQENRGIS